VTIGLKARCQWNTCSFCFIMQALKCPWHVYSFGSGLSFIWFAQRYWYSDAFGRLLLAIVYFFSSVAHLWVPGEKTTGPIAKKFGFP
jgi:hypothetical protein